AGVEVHRHQRVRPADVRGGERVSGGEVNRITFRVNSGWTPYTRAGWAHEALAVRSLALGGELIDGVSLPDLLTRFGAQGGHHAAEATAVIVETRRLRLFERCYGHI